MFIRPMLCSSLALAVLTACGGNSNNSPKNSSDTTTSSSTISSTSAKFSTASSSSPAPNYNSSQFSSVSLPPLAIKYGNNAMQFGELRVPSTTKKAYPLVVVIHGGCWVSAYANHLIMDNLSQAITALGYASWNIEYRALGTDGAWPVIFQDVGKAIDYVNTLAKTYPIDVSKVAIIGHSAGGHLALWAASRNQLKSDSLLYTPEPIKLRGAISLAGIADVTSRTACYSFTSDVIGVPLVNASAQLTARLKETSPRQMLPSGTNTILISGSNDGIVTANLGADYTNTAISASDKSLHYILPGLGHFELIEPTQTDWALYQTSLQEFFKD